MLDTDKYTTSQLWDLTHKALIAGNISIARKYLDDLGLRDDNPDYLSDADDYGITGYIVPVIQDRIDWVNSKARNCEVK
jgi:hypothetical protein